MKATVVESSFGVLVFNEENKLVEKILFPKESSHVAKTLLNIEAGKIFSEFAELIEKLKKSGCDTLIFENEHLANYAKEKFEINVEVAKPSEAGEMFRTNMAKFAIETGFAKSVEDFASWTHALTLEMAKFRVRKAVEKRDLIVAQAIQTLDDLDKTINLFMGRIREWYGIHFPELDRLVDKHETYLRLVVNLGTRENFTTENLAKEGIPLNKAQQIVKISESSMGADIEERDLKRIQELCRSILDLYGQRQALEEYLDQTMEEVAPNIKALTGSLLGARLIALSGGLANLAKRPASTIQVLGAEKALFRSLKTGARPPKHGIIFQHTYLHDAKKWQRGKIARAIAGKIAIAARMDAFGGRYVGEELKADLEKRLEEIREKYAEPSLQKKTGKERKKRGKGKRANKD